MKLIIFILSTSFAFGQNQKAKEFYDKALKASTERKFGEAIGWISKSIERDSAFAEAHFKAGQLFEMNQNQAKAMFHYQKAISLKPTDVAFNQGHGYLGSRFFKTGEYQKSKNHLDFALANSKPNSPVSKQFQRQIDNCVFALKSIDMQVKITPRNVAGLEKFAAFSYFPVLTADAQSLFFTARSEAGDENLFMSELKDNKWQMPKSLSKNINTEANEGTCTVSADGRMLVFTSCDGPQSLGGCDLYLSRKNGEEWSKPENLGVSVNSNAWESQPSLSADGRILYFSSDRSGGNGRKDIMVTYFEDNKKWSPAKNLGKEINTPYDDVSPFIHANGHTLFFGSEGHLGMGGFDLYFSEIDTSKPSNFLSTSSWSKPENLGFPINNSFDQIALYITTDGKKAYYSHDDKKQTQLFEFDVPENLFNRFKKADFLKGIIIDAVSKKPIAANIELFDLKTNTLVQKTTSDALTGEYTAVLPNGSQYGLYVNKERFFFKSLTFDYTADNKNSGKSINISLEPIRNNVTERLNNLFFDTGKSDLKQESTTELNKIVALMKNNPAIKIEIAGHTDDQGSDATNQLLSQKRASAVVVFLSQNGIETNRLTAVGYGKTKPIVANTSEENRKTNRRIEMRIL